MGKFGKFGKDNRNDTLVQGHFLYPDGTVRWGVNVRSFGVNGVSVEKDAEVDVKEHFSEDVIERYIKLKEEAQ